MLVIAATEPCSLHHSGPPRTTESQSPLASGLHAIPLRPMSKSHHDSPPLVIIMPAQACKTPQSYGNDAPSNPSTQTTTVTSPSAIAEEEYSGLQQKTEADKDPAIASISATPKSFLSQPVLKPTPPVSDSSAVSTAAPSLTSGTNQPDKQPEHGQSEQSTYRPVGMKSVVDLEKIYQFMSNIILKKHPQTLNSVGKYSSLNYFVFFFFFVNYYIFCSLLMALFWEPTLLIWKVFVSHLFY